MQAAAYSVQWHWLLHGPTEVGQLHSRSRSCSCTCSRRHGKFRLRLRHSHLHGREVRQRYRVHDKNRSNPSNEESPAKSRWSKTRIQRKSFAACRRKHHITDTGITNSPTQPLSRLLHTAARQDFYPCRAAATNARQDMERIQPEDGSLQVKS